MIVGGRIDDLAAVLATRRRLCGPGYGHVIVTVRRGSVNEADVIAVVRALPQRELSTEVRAGAKVVKETWMEAVEHLVYHHVILVSLAGLDAGSD